MPLCEGRKRFQGPRSLRSLPFGPISDLNRVNLVFRASREKAKGEEVEIVAGAEM